MTDLNLNEQSALVTGASRGAWRAGARVIGAAATADGAREIERLFAPE